MPTIFISYRRGDSIATAGRIHDRLVREFGHNQVFVDVDDIPHGLDFVEVLEGKVAECSVLLAVIGPHWLDARNEAGIRRLDDPDDFVVIEVGSALARNGIAVVPVLVDGAQMPSVAMLPERLHPLVRRNAIELRNSQFGSDVERLIRSIRTVTHTRRGPGKLAVAAAVATLALPLGAYFAWTRFAGAPPITAESHRPAVARPSTAATTASTERGAFMVYYYMSVDKDCQVLEPPTVEVEAPPQFGTVTVRSEQGVARVFVAPEREHCVGTQGAAKALYYAPRDAGSSPADSDKFTVRVRFPSGIHRLEEFVVEPAKRTGKRTKMINVSGK